MGIKTIFEEVPIGLTLSPVIKVGVSTICPGKYNQIMILESSQPALLDILAQAKMQDNAVEKVSSGKVKINKKIICWL